MAPSPGIPPSTVVDRRITFDAHPVVGTFRAHIHPQVQLRQQPGSLPCPPDMMDARYITGGNLREFRFEGDICQNRLEGLSNRSGCHPSPSHRSAKLS